MPFAWDELPEDVFFRDYWRKKPVLIKGGAKKILDFEVDVPFFRRVCQKLDRSPLVLVNREPGFIFAQKMDEAEPRFRAISRRYEERMSVRRVWFDGVYTTDTHTIGCHYDHSDNFVLQQSGTKHWKLASPKMIPPAELRERMLESREVGHIHMPDECEDFLLEASDVLYIPLFWAHWGVSFGTAMSVSLVLNADAPVDVTTSSLRRALSQQPSWVEPLAAIPRPSPGDPIPNEVATSFDRMLDAMSAPETRATLRAAMWNELFVEPAKENAEAAAASGSPYGTKASGPYATRLALPRERIEAIVEADLEEPSLEAMLGPGRGTREILKHLGQRTWLRTRVVLEQAHERFPGASAWPAILEGFTEMANQNLEEALRLVLAPEIIAWIWRTEEAVGFSYLPRFEEVSADFGAVYARAKRMPARDELWLGGLPPWILDHYPRGRRYGGRRLDRRPEAAHEARSHLEELQRGASRLDSEHTTELTMLLRAAVPMERGSSPVATHSIEPFFGTVLVDFSRAAISDLVFEAGRTKGRAIARVVDLVRRGVRDRIRSPFDGGEMSPERLFADAFGRRHAALVRGDAPDVSIQAAWRAIAASPACSESGSELMQALLTAG